MPGASQTRAYVTLLLSVALWGSFPATAKLALVDFPPFFLAAVRCTAASCFLLLLLARSSSDTIRGLGPNAAGTFLVLGAAGIWARCSSPTSRSTTRPPATRSSSRRPRP